MNKFYSNEIVLAPDGMPLTRIATKKANWYLKRGLAEVLEKGPPRKIRLLFEPSGRNMDDYCLSEKEDICVACGSTSELTKHHVVPTCFRTHLPEELKSNYHHDVLLLCNSCHNKYERHADQLKRTLKDHFNLKTDDEKKIYRKATGLCKSLKKNWDKLPLVSRQNLINRIKKIFGEKTLDEIFNIKEERIKHVPFGKELIEKYNDNEKFIELWRKHFVETMSPKHLPEGWSINYKRIKNGK